MEKRDLFITRWSREEKEKEEEEEVVEEGEEKESKWVCMAGYGPSSFSFLSQFLSSFSDFLEDRGSWKSWDPALFVLPDTEIEGIKRAE